ncbi:MAG: ArnT family glycosyltransferase [Armatimonadota bacterium]
MQADAGSSQPIARYRTAIILLILLVGAIVRVYGLADRGGVLLWDEGSYVMEGRFIATGVKAAAWKLAGNLPGIPSPSNEELRAMVKGLAPVTMGKPAHVAFIALFMLLFGEAAWVGGLACVAASLLCVYLVYWLGRRIYGDAAGLSAAFILAISPYFVAYSRMGLAEADFALAALLLLLVLLSIFQSSRHDRPWSAVLVGVLCSVVFLLNFRGYIIFAFAFVWMVGWCIARRCRLRVIARQAGLMVVGFVAPLVGVELLYYAGAAVFETVRAGSEVRTYFGQLQWRAMELGMNPPTLKNWPTYLYLLGLWEGPAVILLAAGTVTALIRRRAGDWLLLTFFVLLMVQWTIREDAYARLAVICLPVYALLAGLGFQTIARLKPKTVMTAVSVALLGLFALWGLQQDANFALVKTSQRKALSVCRQRGSVPLVHTGPGMAVAHEDLYRVADVRRLPAKPEAAIELLRAVRDDGGSLVVLDQQKLVPMTRLYTPSEYEASAAGVIESACVPLWEAPNATRLFRLFCFEHNWGFFDTLRTYRQYRNTGPRIRIYHLHDALDALEIWHRDRAKLSSQRLQRLERPSISARTSADEGR